MAPRFSKKLKFNKIQRSRARRGWRRKDDVSVPKAPTGTDLTSGDQDEGWGVTEEWAAPPTNTSSSSSHEGWGIIEEWAAPSTNTSSSSSHQRQDLGGTHPFVDDIARREAVDEDRHRRMNHFFEMPTEQKVLMIQEMVCYLRAHPA
ncbi:uncharacterized protein HD556DRAFT_63744 [Suillus plorans]|uniref:Uncharacterized protein n=1 Tax=Suillus plorans TaxID=116603 RepID=A0A9P7DPA3_9AGAM|nr:uncharacterized protein HD556DRAFT_63744 [Suillus plorans]KAG1799757.1 hypothetical protein HD556DRAFT_63744 [Suillus plorans]